MTSTKLTLEEARKKLNAPSRGQYVKVKLDWASALIFPFQHGMEFIKALEHAESFKSEYGSDPTISGMSTNKSDLFEVSFMTGEEYEQIKMAQLLGIKLEELKEQLKAA